MATKPATPVLKLRSFIFACRSTACEKACSIGQTAHESADALLKAYDLARTQRGRPRGMTTDNEQDLLRSMLVMAAAGLDGMAKQLITDTLPSLITIDEKAQNSFEKFIARRLTSELAGTNARLLASALAAPSPQARLIAEYIQSLTGGSLQSTESLFEVAAALGADATAIGLVPDQLKPIFDTRNKIIHELDINLNARKRTRTVRKQGLMIKHTERLLQIAAALIASVDTRLRAKP